MRSILLNEPPHVPDDFTRPLVVRHDVGQDLAKVLGIFHAAVDHSPGRLGVAEDRRERLTELVGQRGGELSHGRHPVEVAQVVAQLLELDLVVTANQGA